MRSKSQPCRRGVLRFSDDLRPIATQDLRQRTLKEGYLFLVQQVGEEEVALVIELGDLVAV